MKRTGFPVLPERLRVEVKFTTGTAVSVSARERRALLGGGRGTRGVLAALFRNRRVRAEFDGEWVVVDPHDHWPDVAGALHLEIGELVRAEGGQPSLNPVRSHLRKHWRGFCCAYLDAALAGAEALKNELRAAHDRGELLAGLPTYDVLSWEHREALDRIVATHGEKVAGQIFQLFFAYAVAACGYEHVTVNPVGVPDIELRRGSREARDGVPVALSEQDLRKLERYCRAQGDRELAARIARLRGG